MNVCIYRLQTGVSIVYGRSHCTSCGSVIKACDLVPVLSYLTLRGKCRSCGARISPRYPFVELLNAALWVGAAARYGLSLRTLVSFCFLSGLIVVTFIDIDSRVIPNGLVIFIAAVGAVSFADGAMPFYDRLIGAAAMGAPLLLILLVSRGGMGGGDVKLAFAAGLFLGWKLSLLSLFIAFIAGALFGIVSIIFFRKNGKAQIPFAPFLAAGMAASLLFGNTLIGLYLSIAGLK